MIGTKFWLKKKTKKKQLYRFVSHIFSCAEIDLFKIQII